MKDIAPDEREDPTFFRTHGERVGRDGCRVPLPWTEWGTNFGWGAGAKPFLPMPERWGQYSVAKEEAEESSFLKFYRKAISIRKELRVEAGEAFSWITKDGLVLHFARGDYRVVINFGQEPVDLPEGKVLIRTDSVSDSKDQLGQDHAVWVKSA